MIQPPAPVAKQPKYNFRAVAAAVLVLVVIVAAGWAGFWHRWALSRRNCRLYFNCRMPAAIFLDVPYLTLQRQTSDVWDMAFSPDGRLLAVVGRLDRIVRVWDTKNGEAIHALAHDGNVIIATFTPNGQFLATASYARETNKPVFTIWDVASGTISRRSNEWMSRFAFTPTGNMYVAATGEKSGIIDFRELPSGRVLRNSPVMQKKHLPLPTQAMGAV